MLIDLLQNEFGRTFGRAHDACRIDCLICGNQNKNFTFISIGKFCYIFRSKNVVLYCLRRLDLHQRHMFMRCGMKDHLWVILAKHLFHANFIRDVGDNRTVMLFRELHLEFLIDFIDAILTAPEQEDLLCTHTTDLTGQFRADGAASTRNQDGFACNVVCNFFKVKFNRITPKKVFQAYLTKLSQPLVLSPRLHHFIESGHDFHFAVCAATNFRNSTDLMAFC